MLFSQKLSIVALINLVSMLSLSAQAEIECNQANVGKIKCYKLHGNNGKFSGRIAKCGRSTFPVNPVTYRWALTGASCQLPD